jgi:hypothetical protein
MTGQPLQNPAQIRVDCARQLKPTETGDMFAAILAALLDEDWTTHKIEELLITADRYVLARRAGEMTHKNSIGAEADLIRNIHGIAEVVRLNGDELGRLLGKVAEAGRIE